MNDFIRKRVAGQPRAVSRQIAVGVACLILAILLRVAMTPILGAGVPYVTSFPLLVVAAMLGGVAAGIVFLLGAPVAVMLFILPPFGGFSPHVHDWIGAVTFLLSGGGILWLSHLLTCTVKELETANGQEHLLVLELHHRVKNMLAIVQSLAAQTFRASGTGPAFKTAFTDRLVALSQAQNVLARSADTPLSLVDVVRGTVEPLLGGDLHRLTLEGPDADVRRDIVVDLALCLHELGTNATKHGALSGSDGQVAIRWRRLTPGRLELIWEESGGPPVTPPNSQGFGARLLARGTSEKARPHVDTNFRPEGLVWTLRFDNREA